jgi:hypothetical protein
MAHGLPEKDEVAMARTSEDVNLVADRLMEAITSSDEALRVQLLNPDLRVWHSTDKKEMDREEAAVFIADLYARCSKVVFENVRRVVTERGYLQESVIRGVTRGGVEFSTPVCLVVEMDEQNRALLVREYQDSADLVPLFTEDR